MTKNVGSYLTTEHKECILKMSEIGENIANLRGKPLVVMFYSKEDDAGIDENDLYRLEDKLDERIPAGCNEMDVCVQTSGGDANTSYLLAQLLRDYCHYMELIIPNYAYSGGTLIALASNKILLGRTARISPIDLQLYTQRTPPFALIDIEKYIDFLNNTCEKIEFESEKNKTELLTTLLEKLVEEEGAKKLGELFRKRRMTELHARILLVDYMFKCCSDKGNKISRAVKGLTSESPSHDFEIDYNIAKKLIGLNIEKMDGNLYKLTRQLMSNLDKAKELGLICSFVGAEREPYFEIFLPKQSGQKNGDKNDKKE